MRRALPTNDGSGFPIDDKLKLRPWISDWDEEDSLPNPDGMKLEVEVKQLRLAIWPCHS